MTTKVGPFEVWTDARGRADRQLADKYLAMIREALGEDGKAGMLLFQREMGRLPRDGESFRMYGWQVVFHAPPRIANGGHHGLCDHTDGHIGACRCRCGAFADRVAPDCAWHTSDTQRCACGAVGRHSLTADCGHSASEDDRLPCNLGGEACPVQTHPYGHPHNGAWVPADTEPRPDDWRADGAPQLPDDWCYDHKGPQSACATRLHDMRRHPEAMVGVTCRAPNEPFVTGGREPCILLDGHSGMHRTAGGVEWYGAPPLDESTLAGFRAVMEENRRVLRHEMLTPMRGHDADGSCCARARLGGDECSVEGCVRETAHRGEHWSPDGVPFSVAEAEPWPGAVKDPEPTPALTADGNLLRDFDGQVVALCTSPDWARIIADYAAKVARGEGS